MNHFLKNLYVVQIENLTNNVTSCRCNVVKRYSYRLLESSYKMNEPSVDVIIPAYLPSQSYLSLLRRALVSLQKQTFHDFKVTLVLNGSFCSKDDLIAAIRSYNLLWLFDKITVHDLQKKASGAIARNYGISKSRTKYIAQLDVDDAYMPAKLAKQVDYMNKHENIDFLGTLAMDLMPNGNLMIPKASNTYETHEQIALNIEKSNVMTHASVIFRRSMFERLGVMYNENHKPGLIWPEYGRPMWEDWDLWIRLIKDGAVGHNLQENLYVYSLGTSVER